MDEKNQNNKFQLLKSEQCSTVDELLDKSQPCPAYYLLLVLSSLIIGCGLILTNAAIVIGGMIITPVLTPLISIALGISVGKIQLLKHVSFFLLKSFLIIVLGGLILAFIFGQPASGFIFENTAGTAVLYFIVALASGAAASFAWAKKDVSDILPGIAISVAVVPPLSLVGIGLSALDSNITRFYFLVFLLNTLGVIIGGLVTFSLLKFHKVEKKIDQEIKNNYMKKK